jgi:DNA modification methylase
MRLGGTERAAVPKNVATRYLWPLEGARRFLGSLLEPVSGLYYGDNLEVLREKIASESVDLVYLDPPFKSNRNYNVIFAKHDVYHNGDAAQIKAFNDTWHWTPATEAQYQVAIAGGVPAKVADALTAMRLLLGENDAMAYLVMMAPRLVELHRVLKPTGSLYLHCDPTASHYLKVLLDTIFGAANFRNEIVWKRTTAHSDTKQGLAQYGRLHDALLFYTKGRTWTWNPIYTDYDEAYISSKYRSIEPDTGRRYRKDNLTAARPGGDVSYLWPVRRRSTAEERWEADLDDEWLNPQPGYEYRQVAPYKGRFWAYSLANMREMAAAGRLIHTSSGMPEYKRYLDEMSGIPLQDIWTDIDPINSQAQERLRYPTQKPIALLRRIIEASSAEGDIVLDPFCGCGTSVAAAEELGRSWIGIDITYLAIDIIKRRLEHAYGDDAKYLYKEDGIPRDLPAAKALFKKNPLDFERWAVSRVNGTPNEKQVGDKGMDGVIRFFTDTRGGIGRAVVSVKGGKAIGPGDVRELLGAAETQKAEMGVLVTMERSTRGMEDAADHAGTYRWPLSDDVFPRIQLVTIQELLEDKRPQMPPTLTPYIPADRLPRPTKQIEMDLSPTVARSRSRRPRVQHP